MKKWGKKVGFTSSFYFVFIDGDAESEPPAILGAAAQVVSFAMTSPLMTGTENVSVRLAVPKSFAGEFPETLFGVPTVTQPILNDGSAAVFVEWDAFPNVDAPKDYLELRRNLYDRPEHCERTELKMALYEEPPFQDLLTILNAAGRAVDSRGFVAGDSVEMKNSMFPVGEPDVLTVLFGGEPEKIEAVWRSLSESSDGGSDERFYGILSRAKILEKRIGEQNGLQ